MNMVAAIRRKATEAFRGIHISRIFTSSPVQITEKLRKNAFHRVFGSILSPQNITGKNRDTELWAFSEPFSGIFETPIQKPSVLSSMCRIIFP